MSVQRHPSPPDEADLEITAELPVLDVLAYEAGAATTPATVSASAPVSREHLGSTDTWLMPSPSLRTVSVPAEAPGTVIDENRARLEINLQALSTTLRDVEERLTRKGERLAEIERALEAALAEKGTTEQRARALSNELGQLRATAAAAQAQAADLQKTLDERTAAIDAQRKREADAQTRHAEEVARFEMQLATSRTEFEATLAATRKELESQLSASRQEFESRLGSSRQEFEAQLAASRHELESQLAARAQALAILQHELTEARTRATEYLEALQTNEGRRSVFEELITGLGEDVDQRDADVARLGVDLASKSRRIVEIETELRQRVARIEALDKQVSALSAALAQRGEQQTDTERVRDDLQRSVHSLNTTLSQRNERIQALEAIVAEQNATAAQQRGEIERGSAERARMAASAASLETALQAAVTRGEEQASATQSARTRGDELESSLAAQRRRNEELETELVARRDELQTTSAALQTASRERDDLRTQAAGGTARVAELEARLTELQENVRLLQTETAASAARTRELETDLQAAEEMLQRMEGEGRAKSSRLEELEKTNNDWRATVEEARHAIADRDNLIRRLEQETANSAVLVGHIQRSITRLDHGAEHVHEPAPDGATRLLIRAEGETEVVHVLGRKTTIGRTPDNDLQIDAKFISRHHAVILAGPAQTIVEDLNSTNGVLVNGRRISRHTLRDGDSVTVGKAQFRFAVRAAKGG